MIIIKIGRKKERRLTEDPIGLDLKNGVFLTY